ncbi:MAG: transglycosylase SLT domain-containing protein [Deltaproteobacteria bacterium]|nr:transglycosylase SLT domain-containing protein [Deltaproteobacteria bacterium]
MEASRKSPFASLIFCAILSLAFTLTNEANAGLTSIQKEFVAGYKAYESGRLEEAKKHFENCDGKYPVLQKFITALMEEIKEGGEKFFYFDPVENARAEIELLKQEPVSEKVSFNLAEAYFKAREYEKAAGLFSKTADYPKFRLSSLDRLATSLARLGRNGESILINQQIIGEFGRNKEAKALAMYKIGFLYMDRGDYKIAEDQFSALSDFLSSYKRDLVQWYLAWCAYKQGHFDDAAKRFVKLEKIKGLKERAGYWNAEALEKAGKSEDASFIYREIFEKAPKTYYGILAAKKLKEKGEESLSFPCKRESHGETGFSDIFAAAIELDSLGLSELVAEELKSIVSSNNKKIDSALFMGLAAKNGAWHLYYLFDPYPKAHENLVLRFARKYKVDPNFIWAVMREESTFRQNAVSISGAVGLMQLMPKTAGSMMKRKFKPEELLNPQQNIEAGVRYLSFLLKRYKNNTFVALAAYNAGEDAVDKWLSFYPRGPINGEEFAEAIPYKETQNYVKKVMRVYWIYTPKK